MYGLGYDTHTLGQSYREDYQWLPGIAATYSKPEDLVTLRCRGGIDMHITGDQYVDLAKLWYLSRRVHIQRWIKDNLYETVRKRDIDACSAVQASVQRAWMPAYARMRIIEKLVEYVDNLHDDFRTLYLGLVTFADINQRNAITMIGKILPRLQTVGHIAHIYAHCPGIIHDADGSYTPYIMSNQLPWDIVHASCRIIHPCSALYRKQDVPEAA
jgi:hypothetical protein